MATLLPRVLLDSVSTPSFSRQLPAPDLRPYIELYCQCWAPDGRQSYTLPNYSALLSFNLSGQLWHSQEPGGASSAFAGSQVLGPLTHCRTCTYAAGSLLLVVKLRPGALHLLLDLPAPATLNLHAPLADLLPLGGLEQQLAGESTLAGRVAVLEPRLRRLLASRRANYRYQLVQAATACFEHAGTAAQAVTQVAAHLHVTPKSLRRYFNQFVGAPPHQLARLRRFTQALTLYREAGAAFDAEAAGYADFAHFAKTGRQLTGRRLSTL